MSDQLLLTLESIKNALDQDSALPKPYRFLFLSYYDIHAKDKFYVDRYGEDAFSRLENRPNHLGLKKVHGVGNDVSVIPTISSTMKLMFGDDVEFDVFDFTKYEGSEIIVDLNLPIPDKYRQNYDVVIDAGTSEHIFNYPQVLMNCAMAAKINGCIYHSVPMIMPNHGFYSLNPTLFYDFYEDNGFKTIKMICVAPVVQDGKDATAHFTPPLWERFSLPMDTAELGLEWTIKYTAQKLQHLEEFIHPIQRKYRDKEKWQ